MKVLASVLGVLLCCGLIVGEVACSAESPPTTTTTTIAPPTTTVLPTTTLPPVPQEFLLEGTCTWDLDNNASLGAPADDLFFNQVSVRERELVPQYEAKFGIVEGKPFDEVGLDDLMSVELSGDPISLSDKDPDVDVGSVLAVFTNGARYGKIEIMGFESRKVGGTTLKKFNVRLRFVLYR